MNGATRHADSQTVGEDRYNAAVARSSPILELKKIVKNSGESAITWEIVEVGLKLANRSIAS
jgi:hypothetical protein